MVDAMHAVQLAMSVVPQIVPRVARDTMQIPVGVELFTVIAAAASGTITARAYRLDLVGSVTLAIVTGLAGGLLRDIILQVGDVYMLDQPLALPACVFTGLLFFMVPLKGRRVNLAMQAIDILNVGLYCAMGTDKAWAYGFTIPACVLMGAFTSVGGGLVRDICLSERPALFSVGGNLYAITAIAGSFTYIALRSFTDISPTMAALGCVLATIALRWISVRFDIKSPGPMDLPAKTAASIRRLSGGRGWRSWRSAQYEVGNPIPVGKRDLNVHRRVAGATRVVADGADGGDAASVADAGGREAVAGAEGGPDQLTDDHMRG